MYIYVFIYIYLPNSVADPVPIFGSRSASADPVLKIRIRTWIWILPKYSKFILTKKCLSHFLPDLTSNETYNLRSKNNFAEIVCKTILFAEKSIFTVCL